MVRPQDGVENSASLARKIGPTVVPSGPADALWSPAAMAFWASSWWVAAARAQRPCSWRTMIGMICGS